MQTLIIFFALLLNGPTPVGDCNTDVNCVKQTLASKKWPLAGTHNFNLGKADHYYYIFSNDTLSVIKSDVAPTAKTNPKGTLLYKTKYEVKKGEFGQVYIRIYNVPGHLSDLTDKEANSVKKENFVDFQFLYNNQKLVLRCNSGTKDGETIENIFQ